MAQPEPDPLYGSDPEYRTDVELDLLRAELKRIAKSARVAGTLVARIIERREANEARRTTNTAEEAQ